MISENRPEKVLWNDSFSMYLKPACSVLSSSPSWVRAMWAMLAQRCFGLDDVVRLAPHLLLERRHIAGVLLVPDRQR